MKAFQHETVLLHETVEGLQINPSGTYVDCTLGGGGHTEEILKHLNEKGRVFAFDQDEEAVKAAKKRLAAYENQLIIIEENFRGLKAALHKQGIDAVDGVVFDLGVSSHQFDEGERGFSYWHEAPLDMRMNRNQTRTAFQVINEWSFADLAWLIHRYGEEKFAKQIARKIERNREEKPIKTTTELAEVIKSAIPAAARRTGGHPAKKTFQAIRIGVNDELKAFEEALEQASQLLNKEGRICVISFHSLEDRIAKQFFKQKSSLPDLPRGLPVIPEEYQPEFALVSKKPIVPTAEEQEQNNRARSAKLRIARKN
ncbi:16S rRNA (cytosine(1402)-N(4))-methyltransferase RsmH [Salsuginibacillus kocurii]|uniref:16S rRNA (cytosine(1402)-N(4))-methyltransferase RsmH n=1 Tax=Salsuginibacillus kocurii TaxID=427078 RepID=UPI000362C645|nr:16S rRNA (cytosine(1402)-N(4))-methyltransferase RsmH [Salsuginibacillus kocurii]